MSLRSETVRGKVTHETKVGAEKVLNELGLSVSDAINLMMIQIKMQRELPFDISLPKKPNAETAKELSDTDSNIGIVDCKSIDDFFDETGLNDI